MCKRVMSFSFPFRSCSHNTQQLNFFWSVLLWKWALLCPFAFFICIHTSRSARRQKKKAYQRLIFMGVFILLFCSVISTNTIRRLTYTACMLPDVCKEKVPDYLRHPRFGNNSSALHGNSAAIIGWNGCRRSYYYNYNSTNQIQIIWHHLWAM